MKIFGIIPARYASSRFPGKPLAMIAGMSMIERVYRQAEKAAIFEDFIVATDDNRIFEHVQSFGGRVVLTAHSHINGTSRCAEVASGLPSDCIVINIQGDEPFVEPRQLSQLAEIFANSEVRIATLVQPCDNPEDLFNPNVVKVVIDNQGRALYFSRHPIPFIRDAENKNWPQRYPFLRHIGLYAYRREILMKIAALQVSPLAQAESLEQLSWLENGYPVHTLNTPWKSVGIDAPEDIEKALRLKNL